MVDKMLLRPGEVAETLGLGRTRTYELIERGELPGIVRIGKSVRVSADALREWIRQQAIAQYAGGKD